MLIIDRTWARPRLKAMAGQVLASGEPVKFDSPCGSSCAYNISLEGPSFHCEEPEQKPAKCFPIYEAKDLVKSRANGESYTLWNNAFQVTWDPKPRPGGCDLKSRRSLVCRMKLSTYTLQIEHSLDASRSIKATVDNHRDVWTDEAWIQAQFYYYFYNVTRSELWPEPIRLDELHTNFTKSQAFAIRQAAVNALQGQVQLSKLSGSLEYSQYTHLCQVSMLSPCRSKETHHWSWAAHTSVSTTSTIPNSTSRLRT